MSYFFIFFIACLLVLAWLGFEHRPGSNSTSSRCALRRRSPNLAQSLLPLLLQILSKSCLFLRQIHVRSGTRPLGREPSVVILHPLPPECRDIRGFGAHISHAIPRTLAATGPCSTCDPERRQQPVVLAGSNFRLQMQVLCHGSHLANAARSPGALAFVPPGRLIPCRSAHQPAKQRNQLPSESICFPILSVLVPRPQTATPSLGDESPMARTKRPIRGGLI